MSRRAAVLVAAAVALPSIALGLAMPSQAQGPGDVPTVASIATPVPPSLGNAGIAGITELPNYRITETRESAPSRYLTFGEFAAALDRSSWPEQLRARALEEATCESKADADGDGVLDSIDVRTPGDGGLSRGPMKIHRPAHPDLVAKYDLDDVAQNLEAAWEAYGKAERAFGDGWQPWSKCR